jgi:ankyrin repeat protein
MSSNRNISRGRPAGGPDWAAVTSAEIIEASDRGDADRVEALLRGDPLLAHAVGDHDKTPLHLAAEHDHVDVARLLLDAGADIAARTSWGMTPLQWAATMGSNGVADLLLAAGAELDLWSAAGLGRLDEVKRLCVAPDHGVVSDACHIACRNGHVDVAAFLLDRGADIDRRGYFGATGLHWAAINGHSEMVAFLIGRGARTDGRDDEFHATPLEWGVEGDRDDIAALVRLAT